jgi:hypothetical protein
MWFYYCSPLLWVHLLALATRVCVQVYMQQCMHVLIHTCIHQPSIELCFSSFECVYTWAHELLLNVHSFTHVYICVYMCICILICTRDGMRFFKWAPLVHTREYMYTFVYMYSCIGTCVHVHIKNMPNLIHFLVYFHSCVYVRICVRMYSIYIIYVYVYTHTHIHHTHIVCIHMYIYVHTNTHTHTCKNTIPYQATPQVAFRFLTMSRDTLYAHTHTHNRPDLK